MKKTTLVLVALTSAAAGMLSAAPRADAGYKDNTIVNVVDNPPDATHAYGYLAATRATPDNVAHIGCYTYVYASPYDLTVSCAAKSTTGFYRTCGFPSPTTSTIVNQVSGINGDSYVNFYWNAAGDCTRLQVRQSSVGGPKLQ